MAQDTPQPFDTDALMGEAPILYRYALARVRDHHHAEDLVQDCLITALRKPDGFSGRSSLRTWLTGILRHKILDHFRRQGRTPTDQAADSLPDDHEDADPFDQLFDHHGSWKVDPAAGLASLIAPSPDQAADRNDLKAWILRCIDLLPERLRILFIAREIDQSSVPEAAERAGVQASSAAVLLTRARHRLRDCLQHHAARP